MNRTPSVDVGRRTFLKTAAVAGGAVLLTLGHERPARAEAKHKLFISTNQWDWTVFFGREKRDFFKDLDVGLAAVAESGLDGFEPVLGSPKQVEQFGPLMKKHGLVMRSFYARSYLHDPKKSEKSISDIVAIAEAAKAIGTKIVVTQPVPLGGSGPRDKTDEQLKIQGEALDQLGARIKAIGLTLAYHNHDSEMRCSAREFHHMMLATDPKNVSLCLEPDCIYQGAGNSSVALFDILKLYGYRTAEIHLRQVVKGLWSEALGDGEIDYPALAMFLESVDVRPELVIEQAPDGNPANTMNGVEAHRLGRKYVDRVFAGMAGS